MMKFLFTALLLTPITAQAEVSDKVPSVFELWGFASIAAVVLALTIQRYRAAILAGVVVFIVYCFVILELVTDPFVGPAVIEEQGNSYLVASYGSIALIGLGVVAGWILNTDSSTLFGLLLKMIGAIMSETLTFVATTSG